MQKHIHTFFQSLLIFSLILFGVITVNSLPQAGFNVAQQVYALNAIQIQSTVPKKPTVDPELLLLADKNNSLAQYTPTDLQKISSFPNMQLRSEALVAFEQMRKFAQSEGVTLQIISAYRSHKTQEELFTRYVSIYGEEKATTFSARPGHSEHQLGTTIDFGNNHSTDLTQEFEQTDQGKWLAANAYAFGFVMSYPYGKEAETGYIYEPWHFRYIGTYHAAKWYMSGLTLNSYLERLVKN